MTDASWSQHRTDQIEPTARDFFDLLKPRVMSLVVLTAAVGLFVAPVGVNPIVAFAAILCIAAGAG
ncbi:MAG: protoheme IX farnesyltransferase, partial [Rubricella sp.]